MKSAALVTGASSGIGYQFAKLLAADQSNLVLVARREEKLNAIKADFESKYGVEVMVIKADLAKIEQCDQVANKIHDAGIEIDVLINNAGFGNYGKFADTAWDKELQMLNLNVVALTHLTKSFMPGMISRKKGRILNVASIAAFGSMPLFNVYAATKAYVLSLSEAISYELKGTGVTITTLCPGATETEFAEVAEIQESKAFNKKLPSAEEVAKFGYKAMNKGQTVAVHGLYNYLLVNSSRLMPRNVATNVAGFMMKEGSGLI